MIAPESPDALESLVGRIADEFTRRHRRGERPSVAEYADRHPELADLLAEILPAIEALSPGDTPAGRDTPAGPSAAPPPPPAADYEVLAEVGRGGMGVVYQARHRALGRVVALKLLRSPDAADRDRFLTEAQAVARLQHPNVVQLFEVREADGRPYLVLEFVPGGNLAERVNGEPQPPREAAALVRTLARAVAAAHAAGLVHRDLKPSNILLTSPPSPVPGPRSDGNRPTTEDSGLGTPKISDFGLAKRLDQDHGQTQTGAIVGTPSYMAPEQAVAGRAVGPAADIYALGAILYELITGRPPFKGPSVLETLELVRSAEPTPPAQLQPGCPRDLETICLTCLHKDPARRYATATELADDLDRFRNREPIRARPVGRGERLVKWARRRPAQAASIGLGAVAVLSLVALGVRLAYSWDLEDANQKLGAAVGDKEAALVIAQDARGLAEQNHQEAEDARAALAAALKREEALHDVHNYVHSIGLAQRQWQANRIGEARQFLDACPAHLRHWEWYYLHRQCHAELLTVPGTGGHIWALSVSPDGQRIAVASDSRLENPGPLQTHLKVWDPTTGRLIRDLSAGLKHPVTDLAFSPDGILLAGACLDEDPAIVFWDPRTGREVGQVAAAAVRPAPSNPDGKRLAPTADPVIRHVAFSPDGKRLAAAAGPVIHLFEAPGGAGLFALAGHTGAVNALAFSADGERLLSGAADQLVKVWDLRTRKELLSLRGHAGVVTCVAFGPGPNLILSGANASGAMRPEARLWNATTGRPVVPTIPLPSGTVGIALTPDAKRMACPTADGSIHLLDVNTGKFEFTLRGYLDRAHRVAFTPDGRLVVGAADGTVQVRPAANTEFVEVSAPPLPVVHGLSFSADGGRLAFAASGQRESRARVVSADTGIGVTELPLAATLGTLALAPDGRHLAAASLGRVRLLDLDRASPERAMSERAAWELTFSPDGRLLVTAGMDGSVNPRPDLLFTPAGRTDPPGQPPAAIKIWRAADGELLHVLPGQLSAAFSPDGGHLAGARDRTVTIWDVATAQELRTLGGPAGPVVKVQFVADGKQVIGFTNRQAYVWDAATGRIVTTLDGLNGPAFATPDGRRVVALHDNSIKWWDVQLGRELLRLPVPGAGSQHLMLSPDGRRVAATARGKVYLWHAAPPSR